MSLSALEWNVEIMTPGEEDQFLSASQKSGIEVLLPTMRTQPTGEKEKKTVFWRKVTIATKMKRELDLLS